MDVISVLVGSGSHGGTVGIPQFEDGARIELRIASRRWTLDNE